MGGSKPQPGEVNINVPIPERVHKEFRLCCVDRDITVKEAVREAIEQWTNKNRRAK
jgi:hypothetical protein